MYKCPAGLHQIESACSYFRADFQLLDDGQKAQTLRAAVDWLDAWLHQGLTFNIDTKQNELNRLRAELDELKSHLAETGEDEVIKELRTQVILLQSENSELKRQIEQNDSRDQAVPPAQAGELRTMIAKFDQAVDNGRPETRLQINATYGAQAIDALRKLLGIRWLPPQTS